MKIITLHSDYIKFKPLKKAIKSIELAGKDLKEKIVKDTLVVLTAVEKGDTKNTVKKLVSEVKDIASQVKSKSIVLYPYSHLSNNLASPNEASKILDEAFKSLKKTFKKIEKAPFGYYKELELKVKGHPLSELSREIKDDEKEEKGAKKVKEEIGEEKYDTKQLLREISKSKLDTSKLKENDHRILGQKLDLFSFSDVSPGNIFWHNNGLIIFNELKNFVTELLRKFEYLEIATPQILDSKLFKISGHWTHYKENMFLTKYEDRDFGVKPMNCPGAMLVYKNKQRSYKDLPLRFAEFGLDHRKELSGVLAGLFRLIQFTQDDAHIFCTREQIQSEIEYMLEMIKIIYKDKFNFDYSFELSTRPEKFMGDKKDWDYAEKILEEVLKKSKVKYIVKKGDGAFYGPKIDLHIKDSLGRNWQLSTIQLDMQMPKRFELGYIDKNNNIQIPFVIHRAILGAIERFIGILLEHTNGNLPIWLSPIQVRVINFTDRNNQYVEKVVNEIKKSVKNIRIDIDLQSVPLAGKIRNAELMKIPYIIVVGDKEEKEKTIAVRKRGNKQIENLSIETFINNLSEEIKERR